MTSTSTSKGKKGFDSGYKFINVTLSREDKERLEALDGDTEFPLHGMAELLFAGYKLSFSRDAKNDSCIASLTDNSSDSPFYRYILTGRGATPTDAWTSLCYKHYILAEGDWSRLPYSDSLDKSRFG